VCDLETSRMGAPYIYDISRLRVNLILSILNLSFLLTRRHFYILLSLFFFNCLVTSSPFLQRASSFHIRLTLSLKKKGASFFETIYSYQIIWFYVLEHNNLLVIKYL